VANLLSAAMPFGGPVGRVGASMSGLLRRSAPAARAEAESLASRNPSLYNPPVKPPRPFATTTGPLTIRKERPPMQPDDSPKTSKDDRSQPATWSVEEWWAETIKPYRQQNLTPLQRQQLARALRVHRRARWDKTLLILR
jgi:hypothetical protein